MSSTRVATAFALLAGLASVAAVLVVTAAGTWDDPALHDLPVDATVGVSYAAAAVLVLSGTGGRRIGWLLLAVGLCGGGAALSAALGADAVSGWIWVGGFVPLLTLVPLLYPDGRLPGPRWRPWVPASVVGMVLLGAGSATYPGSVSQAVFLAGSALLLPSCVAGLAAVALRWRRSRGLVRRLENRRIARELHLSDKTVRNHVSNVLAKLGVEDRSEAIARARAAGLGA